jgi:hypothetical protein
MVHSERPRVYKGIHLDGQFENSGSERRFRLREFPSKHGQADSRKQNPGAGVRFPDWFTLGLTVSFLVVALFNLLHHEMWRDELQAWMIARESNSISDLLRNMRYEGHPPLWFLLLYGITRFTSWAPAMQWLNLVIATGTAFLIAAYSPFSKLQKALLCFGYFPLYEYGTISRNYGLGLFCLFLFCAWYHPDRRQNWVIAALLLSLLANTSIYGTMIAMAFAVSLFAFPAIAERDTRGSLALPAPHARAAALIFCACVALAIFQMLPPPDTGTVVGWHLPTSARSLGVTLTQVWKAFLPIPRSLSHYRDTNFFLPEIAPIERWPVLGSATIPLIAPFLLVSVAMLGSAIILLIAPLLLARSRWALLAYASATAAILTFSHVKYRGAERHLGHLFLVFIACLWIAARFPEKGFAFHPFERASRLLAGQRQRIITCLLCVHVAVAATASGVDWAGPFSQGSSVAEFLRRSGMAGTFIVGDNDSAVSTVAGYLDRGIYYPRSRSIGSFIVWNRKRLQPPQSLIAAATEIATLRKQAVLVISNDRLETGASSAHEVAEFTGSVVENEDFYLYRVAPCGRAQPSGTC